MLAIGLVHCDLNEPQHLLSCGARLRNEKSSPKPELQVAADVVADGGFVERLQVRRVRGDDDVARSPPSLAGPTLGLCSCVPGRDTAFLWRRASVPGMRKRMCC